MSSSYTIHVDDIHKMRDKRVEREYKSYERILERVYKRIRLVESVGQSDTIYDVPPLVMGMPLYSQEYAINYILQNLKSSGFKSYYMGNSYIFISWGERKKSRKESEKERKIREHNENFVIKKQVKIPEYKSREPIMKESSIVPKSAKGSEIIISNPNALVKKIADSRPDYSIQSLRSVRNTANGIRDIL
tara:strand:+ start:2906 stop:3475 length:570 start_codon:yes stop_codon:yes gene_type:complete